MNVEAVCERKSGTRLHISLQVFIPNRGLMFIGRKDHDDVGPSSGFLVRQNLEACAFSLGCGRRTGTQRDGHVLDAAVPQVLRMGVALAAIADDGNVLVFDQLQISVTVIINAHFNSSLQTHPRPPGGAFKSNGFLAPRHSDNAGAGDLDEADFLHKLHKAVDLGRCACDFKNKARNRGIDNVRAENLSQP